MKITPWMTTQEKSDDKFSWRCQLKIHNIQWLFEIP